VSPQGIVGPFGLHMACCAATSDRIGNISLTMGANFSAEKNLLMLLRIGLSVDADPSHLMIISAETGEDLLV
jgi:hypothetical protein